jgi:hypothetical protein
MKLKILQIGGTSVLASLLLVCGGAQAQVNSGSNGSDGAFNPATNTVINMADHPNGIYQYTSVTISNGVTVTFIPNANNTPVTWLVQGNCVISGSIDLSGQSPVSAVGALGGPGGFSGGNGGSVVSPGQGPGGGVFLPNRNLMGGNASFGTVGGWLGSNGNESSYQFPPGNIYGNIFLLPLIGGSGGGGSSVTIESGGQGGSGGGGGGGAILIAASGFIRLDGGILANGGGSNNDARGGGGGSGGAVRLVATSLQGTGGISCVGGYSFTYYNGPESSVAGNGRIRFDTLVNNYAGGVNGAFSLGFQPITTPVAGQGVQLSIASVAGAAVSATPNGQLVSPDAIISGQQANPIPIVVNCANLPLNTLITVTVKPANGASVSAVGYNTTGTLASSTATVSLTMPRGGGLIYATAATGN